MALGVAFTLIALWAARQARVSIRTIVSGASVGFAVGAGWLVTSLIAGQAFDPVPIESIAFSGLSDDTLTALLENAPAADLGVGLVVGVFAGAFPAARLAGEARFESFDGAPAMRRRITGAALLGFGAMLAGGCTIGAGVSGTAALSLAAWTALA